MRVYCISFLAGFLLLFGGCKNDLDLLDDYHPALVVYGILNPADTVHYVRVSKVFLGAGNALLFAQNQDSIGFPPGTMDVKIEQWKNGTLLNTYQLLPDTIIPRDEGVFLSPYQVLFRARFPVLKDGSTYKIIATDLARGITVNSETTVVKDISLTDPASPTAPLNLSDSSIVHFRWKSGEFSKRYRLVVRFYYKEQFLYDTTEVSDHFLDWEIGEVNTTSALGDETIILTKQRADFLRVLSQRIPQNVNVRRIAGKLDFIFLGAHEDFVTYLDVQAAMSNSAAALPVFTNINGGYGLFTTRTTNRFPGYGLDADTRYAMRTNPITYGLNFIR